MKQMDQKGEKLESDKVELQTRKTVVPRHTNVFTDCFCFQFSVNFLITGKLKFYPVLVILIAIATRPNETTVIELMQINSFL